MKGKKKLILGLLLIALVYDLLIKFNIIESMLILDYIMIFIIFIIIILLLSLFKVNKSTSKDKIFNSIVENSDTVYFMIDSKTKKTIYVSKNVEEIIGLKYENNIDDVTYKMLNIPVIKKELENWDNKSNYISGMMEYENPKYNHSMWLKVKIFTYSYKKEEYFIICIMDSTKEHDHQHLLITQASDIKLRENTLNEITQKSYDFELNINLINDTYDLKYFKKDYLYLGEEKKGKYSTDINELVQYVNEKDKEEFYKNLNLESLKEHFNKYELDSLVLRYRVGNEIKGNAWLESTVFFLTNRGRNLVSILTKNVTDNAEAIREQNILLQNALMEAKKINKTKTELISTISHDIRTPLTNIVGLSESLLEEKLDNNIHEDIKNIKKSSNDILNTIDALLNTSKIEKKVIQKDEKNYSIYKMFKRVEESTKEYFDGKNVKLNINLDNNLPVVLYGDFRRITSAIVELINNSIKHTSEGEVKVSVKGEKTNGNVILSVEVSDTGSGMSEEKLNEAINSESGGLYIVKNLMNLLDGSLEIESKEGLYTKATIKYVQKIVEDNKVRKMVENNKNAEVFKLTGKKVLIVDDNELNLKVTNRLLKPYELDVTLLENGNECIDLIKEGNKFDLILMDQMMPGLNGTEVMNRLKEITDFNTPIVVLTADAMNGQKEKYLESGFDDYISKPIDKKELSRVLKKFVKDE